MATEDDEEILIREPGQGFITRMRSNASRSSRTLVAAEKRESIILKAEPEDVQKKGPTETVTMVVGSSNLYEGGVLHYIPVRVLRNEKPLKKG